MSCRPTGILFHNLKGYAGWSNMNHSYIDVGRVIKINYRERYFKILDRDKPYSLEICYYHPETYQTTAPVITTRGIGFALVNETETLHEITKRYLTESDVLAEIAEIKDKQKQLDNYVKELSDTIMKKVK